MRRDAERPEGGDTVSSHLSEW